MANLLNIENFILRNVSTKVLRFDSQKKKQNSKGYTLVEILVVIGIIALLSAVIGPRVIGYFGKAKSDTAKLQINNISSALELYYLDNGEYPSKQSGLKVLVERPIDSPKWNGPYLKNKSGIVDPWGRIYQFRIPGIQGDFDVYSLGRDNAKGGENEDADISSR